MNNRLGILCGLFVGFFAIMNSAYASSEAKLFYSGELHKEGVAFNGQVDAILQIFSQRNGGPALWSQSFEQVEVHEGHFFVEFDASAALMELFDGRTFWLEVTINEHVLEPRTPVGSVPYAARAGDVSGLEPPVTQLDASQITYDASQSSLEATHVDEVIAHLLQRIEELEEKTKSMKHTELQGHESVVFSGVNVHIQNSAASAHTPTTNGLGNLIVGFDEKRASTTAADRSGSHNLIVGPYHHYSGYGGLAVGSENTIGNYGFASGNKNEASGEWSSVVSGQSNIVLGDYSAVCGGGDNAISGAHSAVVGGQEHNVTGHFTSIVGGISNHTHGRYSVVVGGLSNSVTAHGGLIVAGEENLVSHNWGRLFGTLSKDSSSNATICSVCND